MKYAFISPEGKIEKTENLIEFCDKTKLNYFSMYNLAMGKQRTHKGWQSLRLTENPKLERLEDFVIRYGAERLEKMLDLIEEIAEERSHRIDSWW